MPVNESSPREVVVFEDKHSLSSDAAYRIAAIAGYKAAISEKFTIALAGGSTPEVLYRLLAKSPFADVLKQADTHLFFGDERCVAPDAEVSNYRMVKAALLDSLNLPDGSVHRIPAELEDHEEAAQRYEAELVTFFGEGTLPRFDVVLLGMGPDGHCASLFPNKPAFHESTRLVVSSEPGMNPPVQRITLTLPVLNNASNILFLVSGEDKKETLKRVLTGPPDGENLPSQLIHLTNGALTWLIDRAAAGLATN